jgi:predicted MFS family arabinose efflux permease
VVSVSFLDAFFFFGAYAFLGAFLKMKFDLSLTTIGVILAGFGIGGVLYTLCVKRLLATLGQRGLVTWGGVICCGCFALSVLTPVWIIAMPCTIGLGFSFYMLHNTVQIKATEMAPEARGASISSYASLWSLGQGAGVAFMGLVVGFADYAPAIIAFGVGFLALGFWMRANLDKLSN